MQHTSSNETESYIIDEDSKPQEGYPTVRRDTVYALLYNPKTDAYLCLDWQKFNWKTFIIGGIDAGEAPEAAALREIKEETGYTNIRFVREIGRCVAAYFAAHKKENRIADSVGLLFELIDETKEPTKTEETQHHVSVWVPAKDVGTFVDRSSQKYMWNLIEKKI
jgi:8-oxo-dGTP pyrophosphatase MutT (NUDIX family)